MSTLYTNKFANAYVHSGADLTRIIDMTRQMATSNPGVTNHSTFIVSFQSKSVMQVKVEAGKVSVIDRGSYAGKTISRKSS